MYPRNSWNISCCCHLLCMAYFKCISTKRKWSLLSRYASMVQCVNVRYNRTLFTWGMVFIDFEYDDEEEGEE